MLKEVEIVNKLGLHARPAALFVRCVIRFKSTITIWKREEKFSAASLLEVLTANLDCCARVILERSDPMSKRQLMNSKRCCCVFAMKKRGLGRIEAQYWTHDLDRSGCPAFDAWRQIQGGHGAQGDRHWRPVSQAVVLGLFSTFMCGTLLPIKGHMMIDFKNLIVGRHECKVLFTWNLENGGAVLRGIFRNQRQESKPSSPETESPLRCDVLRRVRAIAAENDRDFAALRGATGQFASWCW